MGALTAKAPASTLVLTRFYAVPAAEAGLYLLPFAIGNFLGPLLLGPWFDTVGRRTMIALTYATSGVLLAITGALFAQGMLSAAGQTALWCVIFFFASAAASSAYLSASELFPLEIRALAIAVWKLRRLSPPTNAGSEPAAARRSSRKKRSLTRNPFARRRRPATQDGW